jgi:hypothetical protein
MLVESSKKIPALRAHHCQSPLSLTTVTHHCHSYTAVTTVSPATGTTVTTAAECTKNKTAKISLLRAKEKQTATV